MNEEPFNTLWNQYPKKLGKKKAFRHFNATVTNQICYNKIEIALQNYKQYLSDECVDYTYIQHGSTWFNNWEDWEDYEKPKVKTKEDLGTQEVEANMKMWKEEMDNERD